MKKEMDKHKYYHEKLVRLIAEHKFYDVYFNPGGAEMTHPQFGRLQIMAMDDRQDYETVVAFLQKHGALDRSFSPAEGA